MPVKYEYDTTQINIIQKKKKFKYISINSYRVIYCNKKYYLHFITLNKLI